MLTKSHNLFFLCEHKYCLSNKQQMDCVYHFFFSLQKLIRTSNSTLVALLGRIYHCDVFNFPKTASLNDTRASEVNKPLCMCGLFLALKCSRRFIKKDAVEKYEHFGCVPNERLLPAALLSSEAASFWRQCFCIKLSVNVAKIQTVDVRQ